MPGTPIVLLVVKVSLVLAATLAAAWLSRRGPAAARHRMWTAAFASILALPFVAVFVPALHVPVPAWLAGAPQPATAPVIVLPAAGTVSSDLPLSAVDASASARDTASLPPADPAFESSGWRPLSIGLSLLAVWAAGAMLSLGALVIAIFRVRALTRGATAVTDAGWLEAVERIARQLGMRRTPRVLMSADVTTPMAGGVTRPTIFVPATASAWDDERRDVVLAHEAAHLAGRDPARLLLGRMAVALYWFHPLAWLAARQAAAAREQACDEAVITLGTRRSIYARVLLEFADAAQPPSSRLAALPMVQRTLLEQRLMTILNDDVRPAARWMLVVPVAAVAFTISVAAAQPAPFVAQPASLVAQPVSLLAQPAQSAAAPEEVRKDVAPRTISSEVDGMAGGVKADAVQSLDSACSWIGDGDFNGSISMSGRGVIHEQVGRRGSNLVIDKTFGDLRLCALFYGLPDAERLHPSDWAAAGRRMVLETQQRGDIRRMEIAGPEITWSVNGQQRAPDAASKDWADRVSDLLEPVWELSRLRGEVSSLRGQISSILGHRSSLRGEISSLRGQVSSMRGQISSYRGHESSLRGQISSIQGHVSSLRGRISSEHGSISSLQAGRWNASDAERARITERIKAHEAEIARVEAEIQRYNAAAKIREVEDEIARFATDSKVAEMEKRIAAFDVEAKVSDVERRIAGLDVDARVAEIERAIEALELDRRSRDLDARIDAALKRLQAVIRR